LFFPPSDNDVLGLLRFFGITSLVALVLIGVGAVMERRGAEVARGLCTRVIAPFAVVVLVMVVGTTFFMR
jgi:lysylphosphatidylglycerol synthetase-like protein (DUF2156 family)